MASDPFAFLGSAAMLSTCTASLTSHCLEYLKTYCQLRIDEVFGKSVALGPTFFFKSEMIHYMNATILGIGLTQYLQNDTTAGYLYKGIMHTVSH